MDRNNLKKERKQEIEEIENSRKIPIRHGEIHDSEDGEFYGFCIDFEQRKAKVQEELHGEIEGAEYTISTYGGDTEEWKEAYAKLEEKNQEISRQIEWSLGFGGIGRKLNNFEEDKIWKANDAIRRQEIAGSQLSTIREGGIGNDFGSVTSGGFGNGGDRITLPEQQEAYNDEKALGNVEMGGGLSIIVEDFEEVVEEGRLELRGEQVQWAGKQWMGEEKQVLAAMALMGELIFDHRQLEFKVNQDANSITEVVVLKANEAK